MTKLSPFQARNESQLDELLLVRMGHLASRLGVSTSKDLTDFLIEEMRLLALNLSPKCYEDLRKTMGVQLTN